ncbi:hypothetical protein SAY87_012177 [Trapa incisa]|uniref:Uncharacterized protein n=1 Tax=Trapa incisa TaxID=236973 RepID=A0AAN7GGU5_9MYRT|nr:hypothetical protein SAY87_012177 [Trapa incisa]
MLPPDVCPKEDAVRVFLEHLVDPLLPVKCSELATPSLLQQQSVAKQVHAVVILYNYYHRKQSVELEFLYFTTFCKLAVLLRPTLSAYMNWMKGSNDPELTDPEKQFSLTEKAIMDACDVCLRLDPSKETPITKGWPVSKVTVLLVDSRKESFWLQFGSIAQGVWSVIEKSTDEASQNQESTSKRKKICRRPVKDDPDFDEDTLRQLAFSAVKETAGSDLGDLLVLESHVVYSLSKEKSVSCFYIMECSKSPNSKVSQIPAKDVIDRLQEPLITRSTDGWCITSAVEYFLMFPYAGILLEWFSRESYPDSSPNLKAKLGTPNVKQTDSKIAVRESLETSHGTSTIEGNGKKDPNSLTALPSKSYQSNFIDVMPSDNSTAQGMDVDGISLPIEDTCKENPGARQVEMLQEKNICEINGDVIGLSNEGIPERPGEMVTNGNCISCLRCSNDDKIPCKDCALVTHKGLSETIDKVHALLVSRENDLSQIALSLLLMKRANMSLQLRNIEDEIALCDKSIRTIQNGGEDALALKLECILDACSNASITSIAHENSYVSGYTKKKGSSSKATQIEKNPCQELDDLCTANRWILPIYNVSPCDAGGLIATVTVKRTSDSEISTSGVPRPVPHEARESAAMEMLGKLKV